MKSYSPKDFLCPAQSCKKKRDFDPINICLRITLSGKDAKLFPVISPGETDRRKT